MEQTPTEPLMMLVDHEAQEVFPYVLRKYQNAHLVMMKGIRYITITDDAIRVILDRLQRERADFKRTVEYYDREIQGVEYLLTGKKRYYWSPDNYIVEPVYAEQKKAGIWRCRPAHRATYIDKIIVTLWTKKVKKKWGFWKPLRT